MKIKFEFENFSSKDIKKIVFKKYFSFKIGLNEVNIISQLSLTPPASSSPNTISNSSPAGRIVQPWTLSGPSGALSYIELATHSATHWTPRSIATPLNLNYRSHIPYKPHKTAPERTAPNWLMSPINFNEPIDMVRRDSKRTLNTTLPQVSRSVSPGEQ